MFKLIVNDGETRFGPDWTWLDVRSGHALDKLASVDAYTPPELTAKIEELRGTLPEGKVALYNRALGAYESFGINRNGDGFARHELQTKHATFVEGGHYFKHHVNRDPALSRGRPVASAYNDRTDMIDLIIVADMDKCAEQIQALESGKRVPTSMGAKVAYDTCTICDHRARTRAEYCEHVHKYASAPYGMRSVLPDGRVCGVMNPNPRWFDLSDVIIGAAPESETLLKVASFTAAGGVIGGAELAELYGLDKLSFAGSKSAEMSKRVPGVIEGSPIMRRAGRGIGTREEPLPNEVIDRVRDDSGFDGVLRHTAAMGMVLSPSEFSRAGKLGRFSAPTPSEISSSEPLPKKIFTASISRQSMTELAPFFDDRSAFQPALANRTVKTASHGAIVDPVFHDEDVDARRMYAAYRRSLIEDAPHVGASDGEFWAMKCAGTDSVMFGELSRAYVAFSHTRPDDDEKLLAKVAERAAQFADNDFVVPMTGSISGTVAEQLGIETLDSIAVQSIRNETGNN